VVSDTSASTGRAIAGRHGGLTRMRDSRRGAPHAGRSRQSCALWRSGWHPAL